MLFISLQGGVIVQMIWDGTDRLGGDRIGFAGMSSSNRKGMFKCPQMGCVEAKKGSEGAQMIVIGALMPFVEVKKRFDKVKKRLVEAKMRYVGAKMRFVEAKMRFVRAKMEFVEAIMRFVEAKMRFVGAKMRFVGAKMEFVKAKMEFVEAKMEFVKAKMEFVAVKMQFVEAKIEFVESKMRFVGHKTAFVEANKRLVEAKMQREGEGMRGGPESMGCESRQRKECSGKKSRSAVAGKNAVGFRRLKTKSSILGKGKCHDKESGEFAVDVRSRSRSCGPSCFGGERVAGVGRCGESVHRWGG